MDRKESTEIQAPWYSYIALAFTIIVLSGAFAKSTTPLAALDFNNLLGEFGRLGALTGGAGALASNFKGIGGFGAREGFLLVLSISPAIIVALGLIEVCIDFKGLAAAEKIFSPIVKPLLGLPGVATVGIVSSLTSSDAGAASARAFYDGGYLSDRQRLILTVFQFAAPSILINFYAFGTPLAPYVGERFSLALIVIIAMKFVGAVLFRVFSYFFLNTEKELVIGGNLLDE